MLQFSTISFLWMLFSVALGIGYALLLYKNNNFFSARTRKLLFSFRALVVAVICFLLFAPFIRITRKIVEKPIIVLAQDNSASLSISNPPGFNKNTYLRNFDALEKRLSAEYEVKTFSLGSAVRAGRRSSFDEKTTDIGSFFKHLSLEFGGRNVGAVVLATDGLYNSGGNPEAMAERLKSPVFPVALGDTARKKDVLVANINYNSIVYSGNDFNIEVDVEAYISKGVKTALTIRSKDRVVYQQAISITGNEFHSTVPVTLHAGAKGLYRYSVDLRPAPGEIAVGNNRAEFFVEVLDGKRRVFILAAAPHPDIAAFKQSIEAGGNYEVTSGLADRFNEGDLLRSDLVILHQVPASGVPLSKFQKYIWGKPLFFVAGAQSDIAAFNRSQSLLEIKPSGGQDEVTARLNSQFYLFTLEAGLQDKIPQMGQLLVPAGNYAPGSGASVLLYQQQGRKEGSEPLAVFGSEKSRRLGVLAGEGVWRWRLAEFAASESHSSIDRLINGMVQYLADQADKRNFKVYPSRAAFDENERVVFNAELYNDATELINEPEVRMEVRDAKGRSYPFVFSRTTRAYVLDAGTLPYGDYSFIARTNVGERRLSAQGKFLVTREQAEYRQLTANHQLLRLIARESGGTVVYPSELETLYELIKKNELVKSVSYEDRSFAQLIDLKVLFVLIVGLLAAEWFLRKRSGDV